MEGAFAKTRTQTSDESTIAHDRYAGDAGPADRYRRPASNVPASGVPPAELPRGQGEDGGDVAAEQAEAGPRPERGGRIRVDRRDGPAGGGGGVTGPSVRPACRRHAARKSTRASRN